MGFADFCLLSEHEVLEKLSSNLERGLSQQQALKLLAENGPNDLKKNEVKWWQILLRQFKSSFVYLLIFAAILALILGEKVDAILIARFIFINSILGFI